MFFLSYLPSGAAHWQGRVLRDNGSELKVQLYSWLDGAPTDIVYMPKHGTSDWVFFKDESKWLDAARLAFEKGAGR